MTADTTVTVYHGVPDHLALAVGAWLDAKTRRSNSERTRRVYGETFGSFTRYLHAHGLTLDSDVQAVADAAQAWAGISRRRSGVTGATFNHRLAVLSSFYTFARKRGDIEHNPIDRVERARVQEYASARPLSFADVQQRLAAIDRSTLIGARDYALLMLALFCGRRASELAALEWRDFSREGGDTVVTWRRVKGGEVKRNVLPPHVLHAVDEWANLRAKDSSVPAVADAPVWLALSPHGTLTARRLSTRSIALLCERRIGTPKVHTLRHTFSMAMEAAGAKVSEIQAALGHKNIATTSRYLHALKTDKNLYAEKLAELYGLGAK